jgi:hypothetical protein
MLLCTALLLASGPLASAQRPGTKGKEFWLGFMQTVEFSGPPDLRVSITSDVATSGTVAIPLAGWSQSFNVAANSTVTISIPPNLAHTRGTETIQGTGVRIMADDSVSVFALNYEIGSADATVVLPVASLGDDYLVMAYDHYPYTDQTIYPSEFLVASADDGTIVEITPAGATLGGHPAGVPFTVRLDAGQVYQVQANADLTGSRVRRRGGNSGCRGIALFGGAELTAVGNCIAGDHLYDQIYPISTWGTEYRTVPLKATRRLGTMSMVVDRTDIFRILAARNGTTVTIDGGAPITLNAGEFRQVLLDSARIIRSDKPVSVAQYSRGQGCDLLNEADPFMMILSPTQQTLRQITFDAFTSPDITQYWLNIVTATGGVGLVTLDGVSIGTAFFTPMPGDPAYSYVQLAVTQGSHTLRSDSGVNAYVYGYGALNRPAAYGYSAGASVENISPPVIEQTCGCNGVLLTAPEGFEYLWSTGDTTQSIDATEPGEYAVKLMLAGGCDASVQPQKVTISGLTPPKFGISPSTIDAAAGEVVPLRLTATPAHYVLECTRDSSTATLRFNRTLLAPSYIEGGSIVGDTIVGRDRLLSIRSHSDSTVYLELIAALGDSESTPIVLESMAWNSCAPATAGQQVAEFHLNGICREGGTRLFESNDSLYLKPARPDPAGTRAEIEYGLVESGWTELFLVNSAGQRVATLVAADLQSGRYVVPLDATNLPAGVYSCLLQTPSQVMQRTLRVVK